MRPACPALHSICFMADVSRQNAMDTAAADWQVGGGERRAGAKQDT